MAQRNFTTEEKLAFVQAAIQRIRNAGGKNPDALDRHHLEMLKSLALDLQVRLHGAPTVTLMQLEGRINDVIRTKTRRDYDERALKGLGYEVIGRWPAIKQALELFGAQIEEPPYGQ